MHPVSRSSSMKDGNILRLWSGKGGPGEVAEKKRCIMTCQTSVV